jgi:hypothetical protein
MITHSKWLIKKLVIYDFCQPFQIVNIFLSRTTGQNYEMADIFVSHFLVGDQHLGDEQRYPIYIPVFL